MANVPFLLMLEDDPDDHFITESTLRELGHNVRLQFVTDTESLLRLLETEIPALLLLDQNCGPHTVLQLIGRLKSDERFSCIPLVVLGEALPFAAEACYRAGAAGYICKPSDVEETRRKIDLFLRYWLTVPVLPAAANSVLSPASRLPA